ncbi:non-canonical purine NTP pyrophosphatase [Paenibacillus sp. FJAT-26967]|uniref:non-canonical purine NTP pyrophosphatase n=1 Tax=Paenibacillus sp. FJAT-26967 TaxID=1729690 RepID=UPI000838155D|nr:non-canonical purine NTP pyrophosphatase [Paenibacillus sp. FJAT-26967]
MPEGSGGVVVIATRNKGKVREFAHYFARYGKEVRSLEDFDAMPEIVEDGATFADNARIKASIIARHLNLPVLADDSGLCVDLLGGDPGVYSARYAGDYASDAENNAKLLSELRAMASAQAGGTAGYASLTNVDSFTESERHGGSPGSVHGNLARIDGSTGSADGHPAGKDMDAAGKEDGPGSSAAGTWQAGSGSASAVSDPGEQGPALLSPARFVCALALVDPLRGDTLEAEGTCEGFVIAEPRGAGGFGYDPLFYLTEQGMTMAELPLEEKNLISHRAAALQQFFERHATRLV